MRLKFFIRRVNLVFYKKGVVFYKKLSFLIKIADFVNISIGEGKKRVISANVTDHMFMFMFIAVKIFDIAMCFVVICTNLLRLSFKIEFFIKCA